jgi:hypothetical protein
MVQILGTHVYKWKNETCWNYSRNGERRDKGEWWIGKFKYDICDILWELFQMSQCTPTQHNKTNKQIINTEPVFCHYPTPDSVLDPCVHVFWGHLLLLYTCPYVLGASPCWSQNQTASAWCIFSTVAAAGMRLTFHCFTYWKTGDWVN